MRNVLSSNVMCMMTASTLDILGAAVQQHLVDWMFPPLPWRLKWLFANDSTTKATLYKVQRSPSKTSQASKKTIQWLYCFVCASNSQMKSLAFVQVPGTFLIWGWKFLYSEPRSLAVIVEQFGRAGKGCWQFGLEKLTFPIAF